MQTLSLSQTPLAGVPSVPVPSGLSRHSHQLQLRFHKKKTSKLGTVLERISSRATIVNFHIVAHPGQARAYSTQHSSAVAGFHMFNETTGLSRIPQKTAGKIPRNALKKNVHEYQVPGMSLVHTAPRTNPRPDSSKVMGDAYYQSRSLVLTIWGLEKASPGVVLGICCLAYPG